MKTSLYIASIARRAIRRDARDVKIMKTSLYIVSIVRRGEVPSPAMAAMDGADPRRNAVHLRATAHERNDTRIAAVSK